jgi:hypothetical protein
MVLSLGFKTVVSHDKLNGNFVVCVCVSFGNVVSCSEEDLELQVFKYKFHATNLDLREKAMIV